MLFVCQYISRIFLFLPLTKDTPPLNLILISEKRNKLDNWCSILCSEWSISITKTSSAYRILDLSDSVPLSILFPKWQRPEHWVLRGKIQNQSLSSEKGEAVAGGEAASGNKYKRTDTVFRLPPFPIPDGVSLQPFKANTVWAIPCKWVRTVDGSETRMSISGPSKVKK